MPRKPSIAEQSLDGQASLFVALKDEISQKSKQLEQMRLELIAVVSKQGEEDTPTSKRIITASGIHMRVMRVPIEKFDNEAAMSIITRKVPVRDHDIYIEKHVSKDSFAQAFMDKRITEKDASKCVSTTEQTRFYCDIPKADDADE